MTPLEVYRQRGEGFALIGFGMGFGAGSLLASLWVPVWFLAMVPPITIVAGFIGAYRIVGTFRRRA